MEPYSSDASHTGNYLHAASRRDPSSTLVYDVYMESLSVGSRRCVASRLKRAAAVLNADPESLPWHEVSPVELESIRYTLLETGGGPAVVNGIVAAVRGAAAAALFEEVLSHGWWESDEGSRRYGRLMDLREVDLVPVEQSPKSRALSTYEFETLVGTCLSKGSITGRSFGFNYGPGRHARAINLHCRGLNLSPNRV